MEKTLKAIELEIESIQDRIEALNEKLIPLINKRQELQDKDAAEFIKGIPSELSEISPKQWRWILEAGHHIQGKVRYEYCNALIEKLGFGISGYWQETSQSALYIFPRQDLAQQAKMSGQPEFRCLEKVLVGFQLIKKHLIPTEVESHQSTETGIRIAVHDLEENMISVLYVHQKGNVTLYKNRWSEPIDFSNFRTFIKWYACPGRAEHAPVGG